MRLPKRLIIADPGLHSALGHNLGYSIAVASAARERGIVPVLLAAQDFLGDSLDDIMLHPAFSAPVRSTGGEVLRRTLYGAAGRLPSAMAMRVAPPLRALRRLLRPPAPDGFGAELALALKAAGDTAHDLLLLHSISAAQLSGLAGAFPATCLGRIAIVLRHTPEEMDRIDAGPRPVTTILAEMREYFRARLRLLADTAPLAHVWSATLGCDIDVAPLPIVAPPPRRAPPGRPPHLVSAGGARLEKGFGLLPDLVRALAGQARFTIQSGPIGPGDDPPMQQAQRQLRLLAGPRLTLVERPLPPEEYQALIGTADLLLLPYDARAYGPRSSGILAEARAMGVPTVVPAGCWMGEAASPDPALTFADVGGILPAIRHALARLDALQAACVAAAPAWRNAHSPAALLATLVRAFP